VVVTVATTELVQRPVDLLPIRMVRLGAHASATLTGGYDRPSSIAIELSNRLV